MGAFVVRAAGSRGLVDLLAVWCSGDDYFIQVKKHGSISLSDRENLIKLAKKFNCVPILAYKYDREIQLDVLK